MPNERKRNILTISELQMYLQTAFNAINKDFYNGKLEKVVITINETKSNVLGSFTTTKDWMQNGTPRHEIRISANNIYGRTIEQIITTLMHEMVHLYNQQNGIKDTTRGGTYHNKEFKRTANNHGLDITYDKKIGWSITEPQKSTKDWIEKNVLIKKIKIFMIPFDDPQNPNGGKPKKKQSYKRYICPSCGLIVRATKECNIGCLDCGGIKMEIEN